MKSPTMLIVAALASSCVKALPVNTLDEDVVAYCKIASSTVVGIDDVVKGSSASATAQMLNGMIRTEDGSTLRRRSVPLAASAATLSARSPHCPDPGEYLIVSLIVQYEMIHADGVARETSVGRLQVAVDGRCPEDVHYFRLPDAPPPHMHHEISTTLRDVAVATGLQGELRWKLGPHDLRPGGTLNDLPASDVVAAWSDSGGHSFLSWTLPGIVCAAETVPSTD